MKVNKEIVKNVIEEWKNAFPQLTLYGEGKLYKLVGPLVIGLELIRLPRIDEYRPYFVIYSLCGNKIGVDVKACMTAPIILQEYYNQKMQQYSIPYMKHPLMWNDIFSCVKQQTLLSFERDIFLKEVFSVIDEYSKRAPLNAAPNSYLQAALQEAKFRIALFVGAAEAEGVLEQIYKRSWDENNFKIFGVNLFSWFQYLQSMIPNRGELIDRVKFNRQDKKISKLYSSEIK